jgi:hypothetical protein
MFKGKAQEVISSLSKVASSEDLSALVASAEISISEALKSQEVVAKMSPDTITALTASLSNADLANLVDTE